MTEEEYRTQIELLEVENRSLRDRIIELETAIKQFGEAIGERLQEQIPVDNKSLIPYLVAMETRSIYF